ncbi:hypothetical protein FRB96_007399 [Tulasnella sp. 330]|nr:hypothetical protein FRB96_007399 [Tulasnella sp. 330]KAG8877740.1 hypothetical protein FRB97_003154 [Tulasnella sp. 331]
MDNIQDEDEAREELAPLADKLGINRTTLLVIIFIAVIVACIASVLSMWHLHRQYKIEQLQANPMTRDLERWRKDPLVRTTKPTPWTELPSPKAARLGRHLTTSEVDFAQVYFSEPAAPVTQILQKIISRTPTHRSVYNRPAVKDPRKSPTQKCPSESYATKATVPKFSSPAMFLPGPNPTL